MVRVVRNISVRFWLTTLLVLPLGFLLFPKVSGWISGMPAWVFILLMYLCCGLVIGVFMDLAGLWRIRRLVREAQQWERSGIVTLAEKKFVQAVRIFDSAWISPLAARRTGSELISSMARFYLASGSQRREIQSAAGVWLAQNPKDESLARFWLERFQDQEISGTFSQSILTALADSWYADPEICRVLVDVFLDQGRMDFSARRLYQSFLDLTAENKDASVKDRKRVEAIQEMMFVRLDKPGPESEIGISESGSGTLGDERLELASFMSGIGQKTSGAGSFISDKPGKAKHAFLNLSKVREKWWSWVPGLVVACIGVWLAFFVWGTFSRMFKPAEQPPAQQIKFEIPKPFTIQVAAYHKKAHADEYMARLARKGVEASTTVTEGGGKTWYLVHVSGFTDQKSAQAYGNRLKADHIIDDFFVTKNSS